VHGRPRRLHEITVRGEAIRVIEVENGSLEPDGTRRRFVLGAATRRGERPESCHDAIAASYGVNPAVYHEAVRT
jgi:hypothetical protein